MRDLKQKDSVPAQHLSFGLAPNHTHSPSLCPGSQRAVGTEYFLCKRFWALLMPSGHQGVGSLLLLLASFQLCLNPKGNLHFPSEGITLVIATILGYKYSHVRPSGRTHFWGYMRATLKQTYTRSMKELAERGTTEAKWCPANWCNAPGSQESCVQSSGFP